MRKKNTKTKRRETRGLYSGGTRPIRTFHLFILFFISHAFVYMTEVMTHPKHSEINRPDRRPSVFAVMSTYTIPLQHHHHHHPCYSINRHSVRVSTILAENKTIPSVLSLCATVVKPSAERDGGCLSPVSPVTSME